MDHAGGLGHRPAARAGKVDAARQAGRLDDPALQPALADLGVDRVFGQDRIAEPFGHERLDVAVGIHVDHRVHRGAGAFGDARQQVAQAVPPAGQDQGHLCDRCEGQRRSRLGHRFGAQAPGGAEEQKVLVQQLLGRDAVPVRLPIQHGKVDALVTHPFEDEAAHGLGDPQLDLGIARPGGGDQGHGDDLADRPGKAQAHLSRRVVVMAPDLLLGDGQLVEDDAGVPHQDRARLGRLDPAGDAHQQRRAHVRFHVADVQRQGGLRDMQEIRRAREGPLFDDGHEISQLANVKHVGLTH